MISEITRYLSDVFGERVSDVKVKELGAEEEMKGFGYGKPYLIRFKSRDTEKSIVLSSMKPDQFGHEYFSDRAGILLWQHSAFNKLPRHVKSLDVGYFSDYGLKSVKDAKEFFIVTEEVEGTEYFADLNRIMENKLSKLDEDRAKALASYLADIHGTKRDDPNLYTRRARELIGHGECIMGVIDSYPFNNELKEIEKRCVDWRWKLKQYKHRLCMVHGDFHPWNVLFREKTDFTVLDRSRGEWGEAADDVTSMTINYIFFSLQKHGELAYDFKKLYEGFFETYLDETNDNEILRLIQPFYAFRTLVVASPIWYPNISNEVRAKLLEFARNILELEEFVPDKVNELLKKSG